MIVTLPDNTKPFDISETSVVRIQKAVAGYMRPGSNSRIDASSTYDVVEQAEALAALVRAKVPTFVPLTLPNGNPVWIDAKKSAGPDWLPPGDRSPTRNSAVITGNKRLVVRETPEVVAHIIGDAGGEVMPIREDSFFTSAVEKLDSLIRPVEDWEDPPTQ